MEYSPKPRIAPSDEASAVIHRLRAATLARSLHETTIPTDLHASAQEEVTVPCQISSHKSDITKYHDHDHTLFTTRINSRGLEVCAFGGSLCKTVEHS